MIGATHEKPRLLKPPGFPRYVSGPAKISLSQGRAAMITAILKDRPPLGS